MNTRKITAGFLTTGAAILMLACNKPAPAPEAAAPSTDRVNVMIKDWERAKKYTQAYLDSANEKSISFKASSKAPRSFGEQLLHIAEANFGFASSISGKATEMGFGKLEKNEEYKTKDAVTTAVNTSYDFVIAALKELNDSQLADTVKIFDMPMSKEAAFNKAFEHQTHHRGQTTQYLRAQGLTPPQEMLF
jgi:uncharacterized damage-inducible protein DinB